MNHVLGNARRRADKAARRSSRRCRTQIALGDEAPVRRTAERLVGGGLDRHEAAHAVATALIEHIRDIAQADTAQPTRNEAYLAAIERLTAESRRREYGPDDEPEEADETDGA